MQLFTREVSEAKKIWMHVGLISLSDEAIFNLNCESSPRGPPEFLFCLSTAHFKQVSHEVRSGSGAGEGRENSPLQLISSGSKARSCFPA